MTKVKKKKKRLKKKVKIVLGLLIVLGVAAIGLIVNKLELFKEDETKKNDESVPVVNDVVEPEVKKLQIIDMESDSRNIAVMINNHTNARPYHSGLQEAHTIYEIIVEGGYTRYMAVYKDKNLERIGSVRSSRHYFLDYALENDAIYVHWGWSPEAQSDIKKYKINNINGLSHEEYYFFRDNSLKVGYEHRGFTSTELINKAISKFKYSDVTEARTLLKYSIDEVELSSMEGAMLANNVSIPYSKIVTTSYVYDAEAKVYKRYVNGEEHKDYVTKQQYTFKNIITYQVSNHTLTGDVKGRQDIDNVGIGEGYYISNGYAVPITWSKKSRSSKTLYTFKDGTEINVNDGNTFIQIQPTTQKLVISE